MKFSGEVLHVEHKDVFQIEGRPPGKDFWTYLPMTNTAYSVEEARKELADAEGLNRYKDWPKRITRCEKVIITTRREVVE